jgi:phosphate-selective porin
MKNDWKKVAARYSSIDLSSGAGTGGKFDRWSGALSWFPTSQWRVEFNHGCGKVDREGASARLRHPGCDVINERAPSPIFYA